MPKIWKQQLPIQSYPNQQIIQIQIQITKMHYKKNSLQPTCLLTRVQLNCLIEFRYRTKNITLNNNKTFQITQTQLLINQKYINTKIETLRTKVCNYMKHSIYIYLPKEQHSTSNGKYGFTSIVTTSYGVPDARNRR